MAIPAESLSFVSTAKGSINITFNNATIFQETSLSDGESLEKTNVKVSCKEGEEASLVDSILEFISRDSGKSVMRFDAVGNTSTFSQVVVDGPSDITPRSPSQPVVTSTGEVSDGGPENTYNNSIGGINFGSSANIPLVDYTDGSLPASSGSSPADGDSDEIFTGGAFAWKNLGSGGAAYDTSESKSVNFAIPITLNTDKTRASSGLAANCISFGSYEFIVTPKITVSGDYTLFFVIGYDEDFVESRTSLGMGGLFGSSDGTCAGINERIDVGGTAGRFTIRHDGMTGTPPSFQLASSGRDVEVSELAQSDSYKFPNLDPDGDVSFHQVCYPFVIRRDAAFNITFYNHLGEIIGVIPALTGTPSNLGLAGRTDGDLVIERIGATGTVDTLKSGLTTSDSNPYEGDSIKANLARFGVVERDIGNDNAVSIAKQLFAKYNATV